MKRTKMYFINHITRDDLDVLKNHMTDSELLEMRYKMENIISTHRLSSHESRLLAEDMFKLGYLAAHLEEQKNEE